MVTAQEVTPHQTSAPAPHPLLRVLGAPAARGAAAGVAFLRCLEGALQSPLRAEGAPHSPAAATNNPLAALVAGAMGSCRPRGAVLSPLLFSAAVAARKQAVAPPHPVSSIPRPLHSPALHLLAGKGLDTAAVEVAGILEAAGGVTAQAVAAAASRANSPTR